MICCGAPRLSFSFVDLKAKRDHVAPTISGKMKVIVALMCVTILVVEIIKAVYGMGNIACWV